MVCCLSELRHEVLLRSASVMQHNVPNNEERINDNLDVARVLAFFVIKIKRNS